MSNSTEKVKKNKVIYTILSIIFLLLSILLVFIESYGGALGFFFLSILIMIQLKYKTKDSNIEKEDS